MLAIDETYFWGELPIGNKDDTTVQGSLPYFILKYEKAYLIELLGVNLYEAFKAGLLEETIAEKWTKLRDLLRDTETKTSPVANYTWYYFTSNEVGQMTGTGHIKIASENAVAMSPIEKQCRAWNEMVNLSRKVYDFVNLNISDYSPLPYELPCLDGRPFSWVGWYYGYCTDSIPEIHLKINALNL